MNRIPGIVKGFAVLSLVIALGVTIGLMSSNNTTPRTETEETHSVPLKVGEDMQPAPVRSNPVQPEATKTNTGPTQAAIVEPNVTVPTVTPVAAGVITNWEDKLDEIFTAESPESEKAKEMASLLHRLPEDGQVEVANHLSNLVLDEDYSLISKFLTDTTLPESVLDIFMADTLNRANSVKLPALLEVAQSAQHPKAGEAREILELFLEEDYGDDWNQWRTKVQEWVAANPD